jgi:hypothetical protein
MERTDPRMRGDRGAVAVTPDGSRAPLSDVSPMWKAPGAPSRVRAKFTVGRQ